MCKIENKLYSGMRGYLPDFHRNNLKEVNFQGFDKELYAKYFRNANIDNVLVYAKDHWGWCYYDSKHGEVHPKLKEIGLDYFGELQMLAHENDIEVCAYYSVDTDNYAANTHPEWKAIDNWGKPIKAGDRWYRCGISHGYGEYVIHQIREILEKYHPKGLFLDCFPSVLCFCHDCRNKYKTVMGSEMPLGEDVHRHWRELHFYEANHYWLPFIKKLRNMMDDIDPAITLTTNGCNANMPKTIRDIYDYHFAEPWAGNYLSAGFSREIMKNAQIGPGNIGMVYDNTEVEVIQRELLSIGMQGARPFLYSESIKGNAEFIPHEWGRIGEAFKKIKEVEPYWIGRKPITQITILFSDSSHVFAPERNKYILNWWERSSRHLESIKAVMGLSAVLKYDYSVLDEDFFIEKSVPLDNLLVIPDGRVLMETTLNKVIEFADKGGTILLTLDGPPIDETGFIASTKKIEALLGFEIIGQDNKYIKNEISSFLQIKQKTCFLDSLKKFPLSVAGERLKIKPIEAEVWAEFIAPIFEVDVKNDYWMAWRPPNPSNTVISPAVVCNYCGKGKVVTICFSLFNMLEGELGMKTAAALQESKKWHWPMTFLESLFNNLVPTKIKVSGLSDEAVVSCNQVGKKIHIHILKSISNKLCGQSVRVSISTDIIPNALFSTVLYPEKVNLEMNRKENFWEIELHQLELYTVISIE